MAEPTLARFRSVVARALAELEARRTEVNDLNVFPVADGDTGDNMALTLQAVVDELDRLAEASENDVIIERPEIVERVARAALLGARGNSGVILSQLIRGAAEELASRPGQLVDPTLVGAAMARAADRAYESVPEPVEGTILTVVRAMAHRIASELAHAPRPTLAPGDHDGQDEQIAELLERALDAGQQSVRTGPELLPILRDAGVVDAGGFGLTVIFAGVLAALRNAEPPELDRHAPAKLTREHHSSTYRYCTNFVVTGRDLRAADWIGKLEALGDSVLVVGDEQALKVHVHTDEPERATALFKGEEVSHLDATDMLAQIQRRVESGCGAVAVVSAEGIGELFASLGAVPVPGGPTLNPSTKELLAAVDAIGSDEIVILPNSANVQPVAARAAELSDKRVAVVASRSQQAGLAAAVAFDHERSAEENRVAMDRALGEVRTGAVAVAARRDPGERFAVGEAVGFVCEELVAWGDPAETLRSVLAELADDAELLTLIAGERTPLDTEAIAALVPEGVELECVYGGQPSYWWLITAE